MIRSYDKKYLKIALPAALEGLFMILLASADLIMVGTLGAVSIAAGRVFLPPPARLLPLFPAAARHSPLYPFSCFLRDSSCFPGRRAE